MYKVFMVLNENGEQMQCDFNNSVVQLIRVAVNKCLLMIDVATNSPIFLNEKIIGVYNDGNFLVIKNEKSTYCFLPV